jgi:hypothetical protein
MADKKFSKKRFGETYYPISQNAMSSTRFTNFTGNKESKKKSLNRDALDKYHKELKEKLYKENVRPSEISNLDKEYKSRMKRANDDLQYKLSNRAGMKEERRKQKGTIPDTGSAFSTGGQMLKGKQKKLDKNKDGKMMKASAGAAALLGVGGAKLQAKLKDHLKEKLSVLSPAMQYLGDTAKKSKGGEMKQGYGAARTSGMGLQDEDLIPGKSMDYYKDLM